jgi:hypothetical protein
MFSSVALGLDTLVTPIFRVKSLRLCGMKSAWIAEIYLTHQLIYDC